MKFILLFLLLTACQPESTRIWQEEYDRLHLSEEEAELYLGKCFKHVGHGTIVIIKQSESSKDWFDKCYFNRSCDFKDLSNCVTTKLCNGSVRKTAVRYVLEKDYYRKNVECP